MDKIKMSDIRAKFPMYDDLSDEQLLMGVRRQFYADISPGKFSAMVDFDTQRKKLQDEQIAGMSTGERLLAGAGKAFTDIARGAGQLVGAVSADDVKESRERDAPLMATGAGMAGNIAGNVAIAAPTALIPGANTVTGAGVVGGVMGLVQPAADATERIKNVGFGAAGGAAGQGVANLVGKVASETTSNLTQGQKSAAAAGGRLGMKQTPGYASGNRVLQRMEAKFESSPMTSHGFDKLRDNNQTILNRAAAKAVGEQSDELSGPVIDKAFTRIGAVLDSVKDKTPVQLDPVNVGARLKQIEKSVVGMLNNNAKLSDNGLFKQLDEFVNTQGGATREQLRSLSSNLGRAAKNNLTSPMGDRELGNALLQAQDVVEDAIEGTLSRAQRTVYQEARGQYRNLMTLTARTNITNPSSGNVSGRGLASELMRKDRTGFTRGHNTSDMYDAARFYQAFPGIVGDSGTATRMPMGIGEWLGAIPGNALMHMYLSPPSIAAAQSASTLTGMGARALDNRLLRMLAQPAGTVGGLQLSNALQQ